MSGDTCGRCRVDPCYCEVEVEPTFTEAECRFCGLTRAEAGSQVCFDSNDHFFLWERS